MLQNKLIEGEELAIAVAKQAYENKAKKIKVLDLIGISSIADFFVICTVDSIPQLKALRRDIDKDIKSIYSVSPRAIEGTPESLWLIIDYVDVVLHIFHDDLRNNYTLEELWSDSTDVDLKFLAQ
ncbi:MAG: ribosome silencing factor [Verrucomicrobiales bacterium]|nr:ribosome silencing factor [Verrucomicrobiales bacterium]